MKLSRAVVHGHAACDETCKREILAVQVGPGRLTGQDVVRLAGKERDEEHRSGTLSPPIRQRGRRNEYPSGHCGRGDEFCGWGVLFRFQRSSFAYWGQSPDIHLAWPLLALAYIS